MKAFYAFTKKELIEFTRTYKLLIILVIFFVFGMMSPLAAKMMPEMMSSFLPEGMTITLAPPSALDSWAQFYKNITQMGILIIVILFSGSISSELSKGTLINVLTKGLKRPIVFLAKFVSSCLTFTVSYWIAFFTTYFYTLYFWQDKLIHVFFAAALLWLFGILIITITLFASLLSRTSYASLFITGICILSLYLLTFIKQLRSYNPLRLASDNMNILTGALPPSEFLAPVIVSLILIVTIVGGSILIFNKKEI